MHIYVRSYKHIYGCIYECVHTCVYKKYLPENPYICIYIYVSTYACTMHMFKGC